MKDVQLFLRGYFYAAWQERSHAIDVDSKLIKTTKIVNCKQPPIYNIYC